MPSLGLAPLGRERPAARWLINDSGNGREFEPRLALRQLLRLQSLDEAKLVVTPSRSSCARSCRCPIVDAMSSPHLNELQLGSRRKRLTVWNAVLSENALDILLHESIEHAAIEHRGHQPLDAIRDHSGRICVPPPPARPNTFIVSEVLKFCVSFRLIR